jgi:hypothetical protein
MFSTQANVEVVSISGTVRVTIQPAFGLLLILLEIVATLLVAVFAFRSWPEVSLLICILLVWGLGAAIIGTIYIFPGSEVVEFSQQLLTIRKTILGWERNTEYPIEKCSGLGWNNQSEEDQYGIECKVGRRKIRLGQYISEAQVSDILTAIQRELPEVFQKISATPESNRSQVIRLELK